MKRTIKVIILRYKRFGFFACVLFVVFLLASITCIGAGTVFYHLATDGQIPQPPRALFFLFGLISLSIGTFPLIKFRPWY